MPKRSDCKTLKFICLRSIAKNFDNVWCANFDAHYGDLPRLLYTIGPFDHLTSELIQELLNHLVEQKCLKRKHFQILLRESLSSLDLSGARSVANQDSVIKIISARCQRLTKLNLESLKQVTARSLADLIYALPGLLSLNLSNTKCNDQVMSVIGHTSAELRELNISSCPVNDAGAFSLSDAFGEHKPGCPKLIKLDISGTAIGIKGAHHLLENLKSLQYLHFADTCGLIEFAFLKYGRKRDEEPVPENTYQLRSLTTTALKVPKVTDSSIDLACRFCPFVTEVYMYCGLSDDNVQYLKYLRNLKIMEVVSFDLNMLTFQNGLLPVLTEVGQGLLTLCTHEVNDLDLMVIGSLCSNLRKFIVVITPAHFDEPKFTKSYTSGSVSSSVFKHLKNLQLVLPKAGNDVPGGTLIDTELETILTNAEEVMEAHFLGVDSLTTAVLINVLSKHPMAHLKKLKLDECHNVNDVAISKLLNCENSLSKLDLIKCRNISLQDFESFQAFAREQHFDLEMTWA